MFKSVYTKTLREISTSLLWWFVGIFAYVFFSCYFYPAIASKASAFVQLIKDVSLIKFFTGASGDFITPEGYLFTEFFSAIGPLLLIIFSIGFGADAIAGEEHRKTADLLLSNPITRSRIILDKFSVLLTGSLALTIASLFGFLLGDRIYHIQIDSLKLIQTNLGMFLLSLSFGSLAFMISAWRGQKGLASSVSMLIVVISYFLWSFGSMVNSLGPYEKLSLFYYYAGDNPLKTGLSYKSALILLIPSVICFIIALLTYEKRDIRI
jgi:ABC-2 type transport system permease protein